MVRAAGGRAARRRVGSVIRFAAIRTRSSSTSGPETAGVTSRSTASRIGGPAGGIPRTRDGEGPSRCRQQRCHAHLSDRHRLRRPSCGDARLRRRSREGRAEACAAEEPPRVPSHRRRATSTVFPRTPAFSWAPVRGARCYEFELATSRSLLEQLRHLVERRRTTRRRGPVSPSPQTRVTTTGAASDPSGSTAASDSVRHPDDGHGAGPDPSRCACRPSRSISCCRGSPASRTRSTHASVPSRRRGRPRWSSSFGFNMRWSSAPCAAEGQPWARAVDARRGRDRLSGLVPADRQVVLHEHRTSRTCVSFYTFHRDNPSWWSTASGASAPCGASPARSPNGLPVRLVRPVEPDLHGDQPGSRRPGSCGSSPRSPTRTSTARSASAARADARVHVRRRPGIRRAAVRAASGSTSRPTETA